MYQPIVRHNISRDKTTPNYKFHGWRAEGPRFPTRKGAETARAKLAKKYPDLDTGIQAPGDQLIHYRAGERTLGTYRPPPPPKIKKRKLIPRDPNYSL